jgi:hypothetical protein
MTLDLEADPLFLRVVDGLPKVAAALITGLPKEKRLRALEVAEQSYVKTACETGYEEADARAWAREVMARLRVQSIVGISAETAH